FYAAVRQLADADAARGDLDAAIEGYQLYSSWPKGGPLETLRTLARLYERRRDPVAALRTVERALGYNSRDPDLVDRRDRYYYSVLPEQAKGLPEAVRREFDL